MRTVIVGGGVVGLLTALERARAGHRATLVEQGPLPNPHAASYDRAPGAAHPARRRRRWRAPAGPDRARPAPTIRAFPPARARCTRSGAGVLLANRVLEVAVPDRRRRSRTPRSGCPRTKSPAWQPRCTAAMPPPTGPGPCASGAHRSCPASIPAAKSNGSSADPRCPGLLRRE
ncbi:FAD-dependent oxidoreductase [Embleya sp. NPDC059237]|uniref:FAD-dependent oxidoreductase n=1 Tax=Embleya sp. NPDC059237 TaxID=3346784 RepID=UPI00368E5091